MAKMGELIRHVLGINCQHPAGCIYARQPELLLKRKNCESIFYCKGKRYHLCNDDKSAFEFICCLCEKIAVANDPDAIINIILADVVPNLSAVEIKQEPHLFICKTCRTLTRFDRTMAAPLVVQFLKDRGVDKTWSNDLKSDIQLAGTLKATLDQCCKAITMTGIAMVDNVCKARFREIQSLYYNLPATKLKKACARLRADIALELAFAQQTQSPQLYIVMWLQSIYLSL